MLSPVGDLRLAARSAGFVGWTFSLLGCLEADLRSSPPAEARAVTYKWMQRYGEGLLRIYGLAVTAQAAPGNGLFDQLKAQYLKDYGIELVADAEIYPVADSDGAIDARNSGARNVEMALYFLRKEFAKYPPSLIRASGVKRIAFCRDLKSRGTRVAGVALEKNATIYMDSSTEIGDEAHRRRTLHHEFFHFLDYAMHPDQDLGNNPEWAAANAPDAAYGGKAELTRYNVVDGEALEGDDPQDAGGGAEHEGEAEAGGHRQAGAAGGDPRGEEVEADDGAGDGEGLRDRRLAAQHGARRLTAGEAGQRGEEHLGGAAGDQ